ncbi:MAG: Outer membrane vitamin B12 receptor BtuB [Pseudolabrys sp.]|jgi:vitamin B12 transporter|nr:Outer membrane vitamin B12 receptor BtuB [Pseudolabrys sp.]
MLARGLLWSVFLLAGAVAAHAQTSVNLPEITVVSPTAVPTPANDVASSVTVITADDIARMQSRTVTDVLMSVPGVQVVQNGSPGSQTSVFIRGTNSNHVKVLIDGIDVTDTSTPSGAIDFGHFLASDIQQIEVLRGPQSGLYGSDAIGGVISITTKPGSGPAKVGGYVEGGSFDTFNQGVRLSGSTDRFDYAFNVTHFHAGDTPVTPAYEVPAGSSAIGNDYDNTTLSAKVGAALSENFRINLINRYIDGKLRYSNDDPTTFPGVTYPSQSTYTNKAYYGRAEAIATLLDGRFVNTFGVNYTDYNRNNVDPGLPADKYWGSRTEYNWRGVFTVMPGQAVVAGLNRQDDRASVPMISSLKTGDTGGFLEWQANFKNRFFFTANIRHDKDDAFGDHTTYRIAPAFIVPVTETRLKATYGTGFKAPTLYELYGVGAFGYVGNPNLKPESSRGYDFGFEQPLWNGRVRFGVTYFHNDITDLITAVFVPVNTYDNVGEAKTYGYEAFVSAELAGNLSGRIDYTRTTAIDAVTGDELLRRPRDKVSASLVWKPMDRLTITPSVAYLGTWRDINRSTFVYEYNGNVVIANLAAEYVINDTVTAFARVDNLFNTVYEDPSGWLQPGFAVYAGLKMTTN